MQDLGKTFLIAVLGALATVMVTALTPLPGWLISKFSDVLTDTVLGRLDTDYNASDPMHGPDRTFIATCSKPEYVLVGGTCQVNPNNNGTLQNAGIDPDRKTYKCVYVDVTTATAHAICLKRKETSQTSK